MIFLHEIVMKRKQEDNDKTRNSENLKTIRTSFLLKIKMKFLHVIVMKKQQQFWNIK
jgi:hypothetical protein